MKLSASSLLYIKYPRREVFASLQRLGITYVDLWDHEGFGSHVSVAKDDSADVRRDLAAFGLKPSCLSLFSSDPDRMTAGISYAAKIGAPLVVPGFTGSNPDEFAAFLRPLAAAARSSGVKLAVENHVDTPVDSIDRLNLISALIPEITFCYAPTHSVLMGEDQQRNVTTLGDRLAMFYLWDSPWASTGITWFRNNWNQVPEEQFPGRGRLTPQYPALMDALRGLRFDGWINFIVHGSREWPIAKTEDYLRGGMQFIGMTGQ